MDEFRDESGQVRQVERRFVVEQELDGFRLDHYLVRKIPRLSRTRLQQIIRSQLIGPGGRRLKASSAVRAGDELVVRRPARPEPVVPRAIGILHSDEQVLVIDKPAGLPVHASAKFYFNTLTRVLSERFPGEPLQIAHRLDRETSGALVVARGRAAASRLKTAFARKQVRKTYLAVVRGAPDWDERSIDLPLALADAPGALDVRMVPRADGAPALTRARVVERRSGCVLVACEPVTGRQHQIRAHLAAIGLPIVGDKIYGQPDDLFRTYCARGMTPELLARLELPRHALHAARVAFAHPASGEWLEVASPLPPDLAGFLARVSHADLGY